MSEEWRWRKERASWRYWTGRSEKREQGNSHCAVHSGRDTDGDAQGEGEQIAGNEERHRTLQAFEELGQRRSDRGYGFGKPGEEKRIEEMAEISRDLIGSDD